MFHTIWIPSTGHHRARGKKIYMQSLPWCTYLGHVFGLFSRNHASVSCLVRDTGCHSNQMLFHRSLSCFSRCFSSLQSGLVVFTWLALILSGWALQSRSLNPKGDSFSCSGRRNRVPWTSWLRQHSFISSQLWMLDV